MGTSSSLRSLALSALCSLSVVAVGCDAGAPAETLTVRMYTSPYGPNPYEGVSYFVFRAINQETGQEKVDVGVYQEHGSFSLSNLDFTGLEGTLQIVAEGWEATPDGQNLYRPLSVGRSQLISVTSDMEPFDVFIQFSRINDFVPLTSADSFPEQQALPSGRVGHTATHTSAGATIIAGGAQLGATDLAFWTAEQSGTPLNDVLVVDPFTHRVQDLSASVPVPSPGISTTLLVARSWHTATLLPTDQIFFAGGFDASNNALDIVEWFEPGLGIQPLNSRLAKPRAGHTATLVASDQDNYLILFVGGDQDGVGTFELWSPFTGSYGATPLPDSSLRAFHAAELCEILDPQAPQAPPRPAVLLVGGDTGEATLDTLLLYDILSANMYAHPAKLRKGARTQLTATYVASQRIIYMVGGFTTVDRTNVVNAVDVYNTVATNLAQAFNAGADQFNLVVPRGGHSATLMNDNLVLLAGGYDGAAALNSIEIIHEYVGVDIAGQPTSQIDIVTSCTTADCQSPINNMLTGRWGHTATFLEQGTVLFVGGRSGTASGGMSPVLDLDLFNPQPQ